MIPDSVKARHILLEIKANTQVEYQEKVKEAKTRMDSIKEVLAESPQEFEVLAKAISQDPGSKDKGGNLGWIKQGEYFIQEIKRAITRYLQISEYI